MIAALKKWAKDIVTDYDGTTYDTGRSLAVFLCVSVVGLETYWVVVKGQPFDAQAFGAGVAAILACLGAAILGDNHRRP